MLYRDRCFGLAPSAYSCTPHEYPHPSGLCSADPSPRGQAAPGAKGCFGSAGPQGLTATSEEALKQLCAVAALGISVCSTALLGFGIPK